MIAAEEEEETIFLFVFSYFLIDIF